MSANVPVRVTPASVCRGPPGLNGRALLAPCTDSSGQLRYRSSASAVFYCYLLIGGTAESFYTKDEGDVFYLTPAY